MAATSIAFQQKVQNTGAFARDEKILVIGNMDLNIFNKVKVPFTILKGSTETEILNSIKETIEEYLELPFTSNTITEENEIINEQTQETETITETYFALVSKWKGETAKFEIDFVDNNNDII